MTVKQVFEQKHSNEYRNTTLLPHTSEMSKSIVKGIGIGFLSCIGIGIGIVKTIFQVLVLVLVLLRRQP